MTPEQRAALEAMRDAGGAVPILAIDHDVMVGLKRMGLITLRRETIEITKNGREAIAKETKHE